jgi:hypothetical protein
METERRLVGEFTYPRCRKMDRVSLKRTLIGLAVGASLALLMYVEVRYIFPMPESKPGGFLFLVVIMGAGIGWACGTFRSRNCPKCGVPMGHPSFPGGEGPGPILYQCPGCGLVTEYQQAVDHERKTDGDWSA